MDNLECPYCGFEEKETCSDIYESSEEGQQECENCGKEFNWVVEFHPSYTTRKIEE